MRRTLIDIAKRGMTITYSDLANEVGFHHRNRNFMQMLLEICHEEVELQRGRLCALVVRKSNGIPGAGYFGFSEASDGSVADVEAMWRIDRDWVQAFWQEHDYPED